MDAEAPVEWLAEPLASCRCKCLEADTSTWLSGAGAAAELGVWGVPPGLAVEAKGFALELVRGLCRNQGPGRASTLGSWLAFRRLGLTVSGSLWIEGSDWQCRRRRLWSLCQWFALDARGGVHETATCFSCL